jgi:hypothetical protein
VTVTQATILGSVIAATGMDALHFTGAGLCRTLDSLLRRTQGNQQNLSRSDSTRQLMQRRILLQNNVNRSSAEGQPDVSGAGE